MNIAVIIVTHPDDAEQVRRKAGEPAVMRGAGFSRCGSGELAGPNASGASCRSIVDDSLHHVGDDISYPRIKNLGLLRLEIVDYVTIRITHGTHHNRRNSLAFIAKDGVGRSHIHGRGVIRS